MLTLWILLLFIIIVFEIVAMVVLGGQVKRVGFLSPVINALHMQGRVWPCLSCVNFPSVVADEHMISRSPV